MSEMILRRAQLDEKVRQQIQKKVKKLLQQKQKDGESDGSESADESMKDSEQDDGEGTVYLFDASDHSRRMVAWEGTKNELEMYRKDHDMDPSTKIKILTPEEAARRDEKSGKKRSPGKDEKSKGKSVPKNPEEKGKKKPGGKEDAVKPSPGKDDKDDKGKPITKDDKPETKKDEPKKDEGEKKPSEKGDKPELDHTHPTRIPEGMHRQVAIKDRLIDEFGKDAKDWKVHKLHPSQLNKNVTIRFPDGASKKYGALSPDEKSRVDKAVSEGLAASKGLSDYSSVTPAAFQHNMATNLSRYDNPDVEEEKIDKAEPVTKENVGDFTSSLRENGRTVLKKYRRALTRPSRPIAERFVDDMSDAISEGVKDGSLAGVNQSDLDEFSRESIKRLLHQELETRGRSLGDHGVRHVGSNARNSMTMLGELQRGGIKINGKQKLMALAAMADHDIGYTVGEAATEIKSSGKHKALSKELVDQEPERYDKIFGKEDGKKIREIIATHDDPDIDWDADPVGSTVRLADNTSLFGTDKVQDLFLRSPQATALACKLQLAATAKPDDKQLQEDIKKQMHETIDGDEFEEEDRELLHRQVDEMSEGKFSTTKDILSRYSGKLTGFRFDHEKKMMNVDMKYSSEGQIVDELFGDEVSARQFDKFAKDLGGQPVRGKRGNTLFKNKAGNPAFQLNIEGFDKEDEPQTAAMRDFRDKTARSELQRASRIMYPPPPASEKDIGKAKKALEPAKEKFSDEEWKKLMEAFDEGKADEMAKKLGMWPLLQSEIAFLTGKTASERMIRRLVIAAIADRVADTTLQESVCIDREFNKEASFRTAARGQQTLRKDKDLMSDTGGVSKGRPREPDQKPPRSDSRNRYRTKTKTPEQRDPDVDKKTASFGFESLAKSELSRSPRTLREAVMRG